MTARDWQRYRYTIDPNGQSTANKVLELVGKNKQVLELGCGSGIMTEALQKQYHCTVTAIELEAEMAKEAEPYCERLIIGDLEALSFAELFSEQRFEVILAADVLEHLRDPWRCLKMMRERLTDDGYIVVSIPNIAHNSIIAQLLMGRFPYQEKGLLDYTHLRFFTRADLEDMLLSCGFLASRWERNIVPESATEFAAQWRQLPAALRETLSHAREGETYQFIVKAYPSTEAGWVLRTRNEAQEKAQQYQVMKEQLENVQADLQEHQLAFSEAKQLIEERDASLSEYNKAFTEARETLEEKVAALTALQETHNALIEDNRAVRQENDQLYKALQDSHRTLRNRMASRIRRWLS